MGTIKRVNFDIMGIEREEFQDKDIENLFNKKKNHSRYCPDLEKEMPLQI